MYDHIGISVKDIDASVRFYTAALESLGHVLCSHDAGSASFGPKGEAVLWLYAAKKATSHVHLGFRARDRAAVRRFHAQGAEAGGKDHGKPGIREDYAANYYAAFLLDPDGNNVEAVCMTD